MEENQVRKILQDFHTDLSERSLKLLEKNTEWASTIEERSLIFSQFLFSIGAGLLAIFFSVENFNNLILNHSVFNWAVIFYVFSFIVFIFYFKEKLDNDSARLVKSSKQSDIDFNNSYAVLDRQFKYGINIDIFYDEIQKLSEGNQNRKIQIDKESQKNPADYYLELFMSLLLISFWILFFSTQNWCIKYLFIGIIIIFILANNQNRPFYKFVRFYSRLVNMVFPFKNN